jgi:formylglycine-generating enzyme required for sulfatase activity
MPVTQNGNRLSGQGEMGGVWEWTSSHLEKHDGYKPMDLYPAYTCKYL